MECGDVNANVPRAAPAISHGCRSSHVRIAENFVP
jgi:hypothetical protein